MSEELDILKKAQSLGWLTTPIEILMSEEWKTAKAQKQQEAIKLLEAAPKPSKPFVVYLLVDPFTKQIRYVGKTKQRLHVRLQRHLQDARKKNPDGSWDDKTHRANWIRSVLNKGGLPRLEPLTGFETLASVNKTESFWIYHLKKAGWDLTNATSGGDGGNGRKPVVDDEEVVRAYVGGMSTKKIAEHYKTCSKRAADVLRRRGVLRPRKSQKVS